MIFSILTLVSHSHFFKQKILFFLNALVSTDTTFWFDNFLFVAKILSPFRKIDLSNLKNFFSSFSVICLLELKHCFLYTCLK